MFVTDLDHKPDTWLQVFQSHAPLLMNSDAIHDSEDVDAKSSRKQNLKETWNEEYSRIYKHFFNPCTRQFESSLSESGPSGYALQCARTANNLELARMFGVIPSTLCFRDNLVTLEELRAARGCLQQVTDIPFFEDASDSDEHSANKADKKLLMNKRNGCMQFIKTLNIPASCTGRSRSETGILFQSSNLELKLSNNKCVAIPPLCSRGAGNWMRVIVQADQTRNRLAQLLGYQSRLSHLVNDRCFKLIKTAIFIEKSFERQWKVLEKQFDPNEDFSELSKWKARCTLAYLQDHMYALLSELIYLFERVSYKNSFSNTEASKADMLFHCLDHDASLLPYPIRPMTGQEEGKEVCKLCKEAMQSGCTPYRRFISPKWVHEGKLY
jgi:hypothetical protein